MILPFVQSAPTPPAKTGRELLAEIRTPVPFSKLDAQIKAARERTVRNAQQNPKGVFDAAVARARQSGSTLNVVLAIAAGFETLPQYVEWTSHDYTRLADLVRKTNPGKSLEYRRAAYLMHADEALVVLDEDIRTDPNGRLRRALLDAYPEDPQVWMNAAQEVMIVSRFVGPADARRVAAWWSHPPKSAGALPPRYVPFANMHAWLAIAYATKSQADALKAEGYYRAWTKLATPAQAHAVEMFGRGVQAAKKLAVRTP